MLLCRARLSRLPSPWPFLCPSARASSPSFSARTALRPFLHCLCSFDAARAPAAVSAPPRPPPVSPRLLWQEGPTRGGRSRGAPGCSKAPRLLPSRAHPQCPRSSAMTTRVRVAAQPSNLLCSQLGQAKCKDCKPDEPASDVSTWRASSPKRGPIQRWMTSCACRRRTCRRRQPTSWTSILDVLLHASAVARLPVGVFAFHSSPFFLHQSFRGKARPVHVSIASSCAP